MKGRRLLIAAVLVFALSGVSAAEGNVWIAIWRLKPLGLDIGTAEKLEVLLRAETSRLKGFSLQARDKTGRILARKRNAALRKCGGETTCLCGIGKALGVNRLVTGVIGALGDNYTFDLKLVDVDTCREQRRINEALSGREDLLIGAIRGALYKLVVPDQYVGSMSVEVPVNGAGITIDGRPVGKTPLAAPITGLRPGSHKLVIGKEGFSSFEDNVPVRFQQITTVKVDLVSSALLGISYQKEDKVNEEALPPETVSQALPPERGTDVMQIMAWSSAGLTVAAVIGAGLAGWRANVARDELDSIAGQHKLTTADQAIINRGKMWAMWSNIGWGFAAGTAALTAVLFTLDIIDDDRTGNVKVAPEADATGGGIMLQWVF